MSRSGGDVSTPMTCDMARKRKANPPNQGQRRGEESETGIETAVMGVTSDFDDVFERQVSRCDA
jgi:hypothetical protein